MKILVTLSRILVGGLFIFSGLIKLNDPLGFAYKLEDYFAPDVLNMEFLTPFALTLSVIIVVFEVWVGIAVLIGQFRKFTVWSLLLMILFFTFLTFYSAYFNKVTDCGCFGDAIKLTPWESFIKDVILLFFILILFFGRKHITPWFTNMTRNLILITTLIVCFFVVNRVLNHLPYIDFRAYKVGTNIPEAMHIPENAPKPVQEIDWIFEIDGKEQIITTQGEYPAVNGTYVGVKDSRVIDPGFIPAIQDFNIESEDGSVMEHFMQQEKLLMVLVYNVERANPKGFSHIKSLTDRAKQRGYTVIGLSASIGQPIEQLKKEHQLLFDFYFCDQTVLKTIVRSNPSVVELQRGTILQKAHWKDAQKMKLRGE